MKIQITFTDVSEEQMKKLLAVAKKADDLGGDDDVPEEKEKPAKRGRKPASSPVVDDGDEDMGDDDEPQIDDDDDTGDDGEDEVKPAKKAAGPTLADVMAGFKALAKQTGSKTAGIAILKKLGVRSPSEIDEDDFGRVLKMLKAK